MPRLPQAKSLRRWVAVGVVGASFVAGYSLHDGPETAEVTTVECGRKTDIEIKKTGAMVTYLTYSHMTQAGFRGEVKSTDTGVIRLSREGSDVVIAAAAHISDAQAKDIANAPLDPALTVTIHPKPNKDGDAFPDNQEWRKPLTSDQKGVDSGSVSIVVDLTTKNTEDVVAGVSAQCVGAFKTQK